MPEPQEQGIDGRIRQTIRDIPDFPQPGIVFKDITPLLADPDLFGWIVEELAAPFSGAGIEKVIGIESRGFIFAAPVALRLGSGFVPVRKPGKLPHVTARIDYDLEYGSDSLEAHADAVRPGQRVLIVDDVLATGGTAAATRTLLEGLGAVVVASAFVVELGFLNGRQRLGRQHVHALLAYPPDG
jgi:adenine phosphoribosyltransferase